MVRFQSCRLDGAALLCGMSLSTKRASSVVASPAPAVSTKRPRGEGTRGAVSNAEASKTNEKASPPSDNDKELGRIFVAVRIRPLNARELSSGTTQTPMFYAQDGTKVMETRRNSEYGGPVATPSWDADAVFDREDCNETVYKRTAAPVVQAVLQGVNGTVMAYGQTSSGKTHTMSGTVEDPGVMTRAVEDIFAAVNEKKESRTFQVKASYMEIYNEEIRDLLAAEGTESNHPGNPSASMSSSMMGAPNSSSTQQHAHIKLVNDSKGLTQVIGLTERAVNDSTQIISLVTEGTLKRSTGRTAMNLTSSRSHAVLRLTVNSTPKPGHVLSGPPVTSTLYVVDLAGSERADPNAKQTSKQQQLKKEGSNINQSLLTLRLCVQRLARASQKGAEEGGSSAGSGSNTNPGHVPYRDSKLTRILQPALAGPGRTAIVAAITPANSHINETYSTLNFVSVAKSVKIEARANVVGGKNGAGKGLETEAVKELQSQLASEQIKQKQSEEEHERVLEELSKMGARVAAAESRADACSAATEFAERAAQSAKESARLAELRAEAAEKERDQTAKHAATAASAFMDAKSGNKAETSKLLVALEELEHEKAKSHKLETDTAQVIDELTEQLANAQEALVAAQNETQTAKEAEDAALVEAAKELESLEGKLKAAKSEVEGEKQRCAAMKGSLDRARGRVVEAEKAAKLAKEESVKVSKQLEEFEETKKSDKLTGSAEQKTLTAEVERRVEVELALESSERKVVTLSAELLATKETLGRVEKQVILSSEALELERVAAKELDEAATMALGEVERLTGQVDSLTGDLTHWKHTSEQFENELTEAKVDLEIAREELEELRRYPRVASPFSPGTAVHASMAMEPTLVLTEAASIETAETATVVTVCGEAAVEHVEAATAVTHVATEVQATEEVAAEAPKKRRRGRPKKIRTEAEQAFVDLKLKGKKGKAKNGDEVDKENPSGGVSGVTNSGFSLKSMISAVGVKKKKAPLGEKNENVSANQSTGASGKSQTAKRRRLANVASLRDIIGSPLENGRFMR